MSLGLVAKSGHVLVNVSLAILTLQLESVSHTSNFFKITVHVVVVIVILHHCHYPFSLVCWLRAIYPDELYNPCRRAKATVLAVCFVAFGA